MKNTFPVRCRDCGEVHGFERWSQLPYVGLFKRNDDVEFIVSRTCVCGAVLGVLDPLEGAYGLLAAGDVEGLYEAARGSVLSVALAYQEVARDTESESAHDLAHEFFAARGLIDRLAIEVPDTLTAISKALELEADERVRTRLTIACEILDVFAASLTDDVAQRTPRFTSPQIAGAQ